MPDVVYHLVRPEEVYFAAANGLPARYSSARWGAQFDAEYGRYQRGESRIYELIFNTRPVHAYLMEGNSLVAQTLVIAHCLGHGWVFEHNRWLGAVDRAIMPRVLAAAERIADYMGAHGRERVEDFLDACHAVAIHQPQAQLIRRAATPEPEHRAEPLRRALPRRGGGRPPARRGASAPRLRTRFPRDPEQDLLGFIERHARGLEDWQRDVMSIVHAEQSYFLPQLRTKLLNEGAAVLCHQEIVPAPVPAQRPLLGVRGAQRRRRRATPGAGQPVQPRHRADARDHAHRGRARRRGARALELGGRRWSRSTSVRSVLRSYDDEALLREFLSPKVCEECRLYAFEHLPRDPRAHPRLLARGATRSATC